jgi:photosystem II stability/assembly factor-like uncharacterized protein
MAQRGFAAKLGDRRWDIGDRPGIVIGLPRNPQPGCTATENSEQKELGVLLLLSREMGIVGFMKSLTLGLLCTVAAAAASFGPAPRFDAWKVIGPGGGGRTEALALNPSDPKMILVRCDMLGAYISHDAGESWRMFNLGGPISFFAFSPAAPETIYANVTSPAPAPGLFRSLNGGKIWSRVSGPVTALAVDPADPKTLYASVKTALRVSTDGGEHWNQSAELQGAGMKIYIDPRSPRDHRALYVVGRNSVAARESGQWIQQAPPAGVTTFIDASMGFPPDGSKPVVYALTLSAVYVSVDGGASWRSSHSMNLQRTYAAPDDPFHRHEGYYAVAVAPGQPAIAYFSYSGLREGGGTYFGVARTEDAGQTWQLVWKEHGDENHVVRDAWANERFPGRGREPKELQVSAADPNTCFGTGGTWVVRTTDGAKSWDALYSKKAPGGGYTSTGLDVLTCYGIHFDPFDKRRIFIGFTDVGLFRSEDGGASWFSSTTGVPHDWVNTTYWMEFDPAVKGLAWAVTSQTHDLPRSKMWRDAPPSSFTGGVVVSGDGGRSWKASSNGMPGTAATHILLDPTSPVGARVLYATGFGRGVFKSIDNGKSWALKNNGIRGKEPFAWRLARDKRGVLYLVVARRSDNRSYGNDEDGALYRSRDGAEHWEEMKLPRGVNGPSGIAADPENPDRLYVAAWGRGNPEPVDGGVFLSEDGGNSWRNIHPQARLVYDVTIDPRDPNTIYACGFESSAWRSTDRGKTWSRIRGFNFKWGHRVIPDPFDPKLIYITTFGGSVWHGPAAGDPNAAEDVQ